MQNRYLWNQNFKESNFYQLEKLFKNRKPFRCPGQTIIERKKQLQSG
jgi:hypothetical protein